MKILTFSVLAAASVQPVLACDLCAVYAATEAQGGGGIGFFGGVAEQFTRFRTLQDEGHEVASDGQYIESSVSQLFAGYNFNDRLSLQLNLPIIYRAFGSDSMKGTEEGIGDLSVISNFRVFETLSETSTFRWTVLGGFKSPTGDSSRLNTPDSELPEGIGGHDLALGSGSFDGVVGTGLYARWKKSFLTANVQYAIRTEGDFQHQYANDITWSAGPGAFLILNHKYTLTLQAVVSGEKKGKDTFAGEPDDDSAESLVFAGPQINFTWKSKLSAQLGADFPVSMGNSGLQVMPDYRIRAALTWRL
jgi:hypothetical protein